MKQTSDNKKNKIVIPVPTIRRLPLYLSFLKSMKIAEIKFISAPRIAKELHIDPTQITKDFSYINITGKTKIGYETSTLISVIEAYLNYHDIRKAFIVGIGNLGVALIEYKEFSEKGMKILAGFDIDEEKTGQVINEIKILNINNFKKEYTKTPVDIGIITVPASQAQRVADIIINCGIKAIWNFSARPISAPDNIIIENTSIDSGLAMIKWKMNKNKPMIYKNRIL